MNSKTTGFRLIWKKRIGRIQSRNNIIAISDDLLLGTCGRRWNLEDSDDGVYRLDRQTGDVIWFTPTISDTNEIVLLGEFVWCPTDRGDIFVLNATSGEIADVFRLDSAAISKPLVWADERGWEAIAISAAGTIYRFTSGKRGVVILGSLNEPVRANLLDVGTSSKREFIVTTESGLVVRCVYNNDRLTHRVIGIVTYTGHPFSENGVGTETVGSIHAAPNLDGNHLYVGFARKTYYSEPPLICLDSVTGETVWRALQLPQGDCGNCRVTPIFNEHYLVAAFSYSNGIHIFDKANGKLLGAVRIGRTVWQQWSAPVFYGKHHVILGRVDGTISMVNMRELRVVASISFANRDSHLLKIEDSLPGEVDPLFPGARPRGICSTPVVLNGIIYVGTTSSDLISVEVVV